MRHKKSWKKTPPVPFIVVLPLIVHTEILNGQQDPKLYYLESSLCATIAIEVVRGKSKMPLLEPLLIYFIGFTWVRANGLVVLSVFK